VDKHTRERLWHVIAPLQGFDNPWCPTTGAAGPGYSPAAVQA
jgi:hypothetical protein